MQSGRVLCIAMAAKWMGQARRPMDDQAVAQVAAFMVAGIVFLGSIGSLLVVSKHRAPNAAPVEDADMQAKAEALSRIILGSPGYTTSGKDWADGAQPGTGISANANG